MAQTSVTRTSIMRMARIINDATEKGYTVVSARPLRSTDLTYAFYSLQGRDIFGDIQECYFTAYINDYDTVIYKPLSATEFFSDEV